MTNKELKEYRSYTDNPVLPVCKNCTHFKYESEKKEGFFGGVYVQQKKLRCGIGGFAVKKMASCRAFQATPIS